MEKDRGRLNQFWDHALTLSIRKQRTFPHSTALLSD